MIKLHLDWAASRLFHCDSTCCQLIIIILLPHNQLLGLFPRAVPHPAFQLWGQLLNTPLVFYSDVHGQQGGLLQTGLQSRWRKTSELLSFNQRAIQVIICLRKQKLSPFKDSLTGHFCYLVFCLKSQIWHLNLLASHYTLILLRLFSDCLLSNIL